MTYLQLRNGFARHLSKMLSILLFETFVYETHVIKLLHCKTTITCIPSNLLTTCLQPWKHFSQWLSQCLWIPQCCDWVRSHDHIKHPKPSYRGSDIGLHLHGRFTAISTPCFFKPCFMLEVYLRQLPHKGELDNFLIFGSIMGLLLLTVVLIVTPGASDTVPLLSYPRSSHRDPHLLIFLLHTYLLLPSFLGFFL